MKYLKPGENHKNEATMDTTKEYQDMCEAAPEIQSLWHKKYNKPLGDFVYSPTHEQIFTIFDGVDGEYTRSLKQIARHHPEINNCIWLPRQDKLQEMLNLQPHSFGKSYEIKMSRINGYWKMVCKNDPLRYSFSMKSKSMEQLWLAFIMSEKYNKEWTSTEWVKIK